MAKRASNRDRVQRMALEAELSAKEKATTKKKKKTAKKKTSSTRKAAASSGERLKIVWKVFDDKSKEIAVYPFPEKAKAEERAEKLTKRSKREHRVRDVRVPMED